jgi:hypothetical protein
MYPLCLPVIMAAKKAKNSTKSKKTTSKKSNKKGTKTKAKGKNSNSKSFGEDVGIVVIDEDLKIDKDAELEARRAYLEEARSQEASD